MISEGQFAKLSKWPEETPLDRGYASHSGFFPRSGFRLRELPVVGVFRLQGTGRFAGTARKYDIESLRVMTADGRGE